MQMILTATISTIKRFSSSLAAAKPQQKFIVVKSGKRQNGSWTEEELKTLVKTRLEGCEWTQIANRLNRTYQSCVSAFRYHWKSRVYTRQDFQRYTLLEQPNN